MGFSYMLLLFTLQFHGLMNGDLAIRFNLMRQKYKKYFENGQNLIVGPDWEAVRKNLPSSFSSFKNCVCIIDCTEIFIEKPQNQLAQAQVFSNYKSHNAVKYLIGITTAGAVTCGVGWKCLRQNDNIKFRLFRNGFLW